MNNDSLCQLGLKLAKMDDIKLRCVLRYCFTFSKELGMSSFARRILFRAYALFVTAVEKKENNNYFPKLEDMTVKYYVKDNRQYCKLMSGNNLIKDEIIENVAVPNLWIAEIVSKME